MPREFRPAAEVLELRGEVSGQPFKDRLQRRPHHFPARGGSDQELAVRIDHDGAGGFFPLGTADGAVAASKAGQIYHLVVTEGWNAACRRFPRELVVSFEWSLEPVLWTYTTIHTLIGERSVRETDTLQNDGSRQRVLVVEPDAGVRRALCWSINQRPRYASVACDSPEAFIRALSVYDPSLVLLNRNLAGRLNFASAGVIAPIRPGVPALAYAVHSDGDQMFDCLPGEAESYLLKRIQPERLLDPILNASNRPGLMIEDLLSSVRSYFQLLLQPRSGRDALTLAKLPRREREVLALLSKGWGDKEIAKAMGISVWTAHEYVKKIFQRLQVRTRTEAVVRYLGR